MTPVAITDALRILRLRRHVREQAAATGIYGGMVTAFVILAGMNVRHAAGWWLLGGGFFAIGFVVSLGSWWATGTVYMNMLTNLEVNIERDSRTAEESPRTHPR